MHVKWIKNKRCLVGFLEIKTQKMIKNRDGMTTTTCDFLPGNERCSSSPISKIFSLASFVSPSKSPEDFVDLRCHLKNYRCTHQTTDLVRFYICGTRCSRRIWIVWSRMLLSAPSDVTVQKIEGCFTNNYGGKWNLTLCPTAHHHTGVVWP